MIENLVKQWLFQRKNKSYFTSNNDLMVFYGLRLFTEWMIQNHKKVFKQFLENERFQAKTTINLIFQNLAESISDLLY